MLNRCCYLKSNLPKQRPLTQNKSSHYNLCPPRNSQNKRNANKGNSQMPKYYHKILKALRETCPLTESLYLSLAIHWARHRLEIYTHNVGTRLDLYIPPDTDSHDQNHWYSVKSINWPFIHEEISGFYFG